MRKKPETVGKTKAAKPPRHAFDPDPSFQDPKKLPSVMHFDCADTTERELNDELAREARNDRISFLESANAELLKRITDLEAVVKTFRPGYFAAVAVAAGRSQSEGIPASARSTPTRTYSRESGTQDGTASK